MKKIIIVLICSFAATIIFVTGIFGYIYYDFHINGFESAEYAHIDKFDCAVNVAIENLNAELEEKNGILQISSSCEEKTDNGIKYSATIERNEETGTLMFVICQQSESVSPFNTKYISFTEGIKNESGKYDKMMIPHREAIDKNGNKLILEPAGSEAIDKNGCKKTEYYIRYGDFGDYLKAKDIETVFPISAQLNGHIVSVERRSLF